MEGVSVNVYKGIKEYLKTKRKGYERLNRPGRRRKCSIELGSGDGAARKKTSWRLKLTPRLKLRFKIRFSPKKMLIRIRDAYVNLMLRVANTRAIGGGMGGFAASGNAISSFTTRSVKEYDEKMVIQIYKSLLIAQGQTQTVPGDAPPRIGTSIRWD